MRRLTMLLLVALLASGCVSLPESGPVREAPETTTRQQQGGIHITPRPPTPGATTVEIAQGFLDAMTATPIQFATAREFLTDDLASTWDPDAETITYAEAPVAREGQRVEIRLDGANRLDARHAWQGPVPPSQQQVSLGLVREDGEWRIASAPDALIVPESWFEEVFRQVSLYYFDPSGVILVPEQVFVPRGDQLASALVTGLLAGPGSPVVRSYLAPGMRLDLSVQLRDGTADISLVGVPGYTASDAGEQLVAQLAWTLRQDASIDAFRLSIGGTPVRLAGGQTEFAVDEGAEYDPTGFQASRLLYALQDGLLVSGAADDLGPVDGPFGATAYGLRSVAVDLPASRAAGVTEDGSTVLVGPVREDGSVETVVSGGTDLLRPSWDVAGRLWLVDRRADGAVVSYVRGERQRAVEVPGISGEQVKDLLVSRDGTRLVAVLRGANSDSVVVSRVEYDPTGRSVVSVSPASRIDDRAESERRIRDVGWGSPTTLVVLQPQPGSFTQVRALSVDGSPLGEPAPSVSTTLLDEATGLATSPVRGETQYVVLGEALKDLGSNRYLDVPLEGEVRSLGYVG